MGAWVGCIALWYSACGRRILCAGGAGGSTAGWRTLVLPQPQAAAHAREQLGHQQRQQRGQRRHLPRLQRSEVCVHRVGRAPQVRLSQCGRAVRVRLGKLGRAAQDGLHLGAGTLPRVPQPASLAQQPRRHYCRARVGALDRR